MEYKRIEELTTVVTGGTPSTAKNEYWDNGDIPWLQSGCCQNCDVSSAEKYITQEGYDNSSTRMMPPDTVMIALTGATAGKVGYLNFEACGNQSITGIFPCESMNQRYLFYFLLSQRNKILSDCVGGAQAHISQGYVKNIEVPVPDLVEQEKVVTVLVQLSKIISERQTELSSLDKLIKARFVELFGDPKQNPKGYSVKEFDEISVLITDGEHATPRRTDKGIYLLSARNILNHALQLDDVDYIDEEEYTRIARRIVPQAGDVLISCSGSIGRCCVVPEELRFQMVRSAALIRFDDTIKPIFAEWLITSDELQRQISMSATQSSQANLFQGKIRKLRGYVPPMELQNQFADFVKQVDKSKFEVQKALYETQKLFDSLMQQYFG